MSESPFRPGGSMPTAAEVNRWLRELVRAEVEKQLWDRPCTCSNWNCPCHPEQERDSGSIS
jgi:hypothetical protein